MRSGLLRRILAVTVAVAGLLALAALSRVPWRPASPSERASLAAGAEAAPGERAIVRLSWRAPGELVNECRRLTPEEINRLPVHMRREEVCEGRIRPYRLRVELDGRLVVDETVRAAGAREDRPLYVYRELVVAPGEYELDIDWEQEGGASPDEAGAGSGDGAADMTEGRVPVASRSDERGRLQLHAGLRLEPGDIALITYDPDERVLAARGAGTRTETPGVDHTGR